MSRGASLAGARTLSLPEELERLEQSITLTLQEIDSNFSKAHRIVTTSILPLVEQYGEHSRSVWDASKFWKQFFEASANVSLSGYEELAGASGDGEGGVVADDNEGETSLATATGAEDETESTALHDGTVQDATLTAGGDATAAGRRPAADDSLLMLDDDHTDTLAGSTPRPADRTAGVARTPSSSTLAARLVEAATRRSGGAGSTARKHPQRDPLLHRVLDKTYRVGATPLRGHAGVGAGAGTGAGSGAATAASTTPSRRRPAADDSPMSSPLIPLPQLRSAAFLSPMRPALRGAAPTAPRTPGVSVQRLPRPHAQQTPLSGSRRRFGAPGAPATAAVGASMKNGRDEITWESDDEDLDGTSEVLLPGMSPPKTIQFALPPSRLLQTPAREASRRIVEDILLTAGAGTEDSAEEYSPTMVKMNEDILDESF